MGSRFLLPIFYIKSSNCKSYKAFYGITIGSLGFYLVILTMKVSMRIYVGLLMKQLIHLFQSRSYLLDINC